MSLDCVFIVILLLYTWPSGQTWPPSKGKNSNGSKTNDLFFTTFIYNNQRCFLDIWTFLWSYIFFPLTSYNRPVIKLSLKIDTDSRTLKKCTQLNWLTNIDMALRRAQTLQGSFDMHFAVSLFGLRCHRLRILSAFAMNTTSPFGNKFR